MAEAAPGWRLLEQFAAFYEEVARIKRAVASSQWPPELAALAQPPADGAVLASRISNWLHDRLAAQELALRRHATQAQLRAWGVASYVMTVLADEVFIFELPGPQQRPWLGVLLEQRRFHTHEAGRRFFELAEQLVAAPTPSALHRDLAACFLLALQLGFKGRHRGAQGAPHLAGLRERLHRFIHAGADGHGPQAFFPQALEHTVVSSRNERIAPLAPWRRAFWRWAAAYLVLSTALWLWLTRPLLMGAAG